MTIYNLCFLTQIDRQIYLGALFPTTVYTDNRKSRDDFKDAEEKKHQSL
jgi:hypothetical protein